MIETTPYLHLRYERTDCALMCTPAVKEGRGKCSHGDFEKAFTLRQVYTWYLQWLRFLKCCVD